MQKPNILSVSVNQKKHRNFKRKSTREVTVFLLVNVVKIYQSKAKDSEISSCQLHLGNISKDCTNIKETGLYVERGFNVNKDML